jgi:hypothetical protein
MSKIVTANMLATGAVVFLAEGDRWVESVESARTFADAAEAEVGLAIAERDVKRAIVVDPFVTGRDAAPPGKTGMTLRDSIRAFGPTVGVGRRHAG